MHTGKALVYGAVGPGSSCRGFESILGYSVLNLTYQLIKYQYSHYTRCKGMKRTIEIYISSNLWLNPTFIKLSEISHYLQKL